MIFETEKETKYVPTLVDEGIYDLTFKGVRPVKDGEYGPRIGFVYTLVHNGATLEIIQIIYKRKPNKKNNLGQTLIALGGKIEDEKIDTDKLLGAQVKGLVENLSRTDADGNVHKESYVTKLK